MKVFTTFVCLALAAWICSSCSTSPNGFAELDAVLERRSEISRSFEENLNRLKQNFAEADGVRKAEYADSIFQIYMDAYTDSAYIYARKKYELYRELGDTANTLNSKMDYLVCSNSVDLNSSIEQLESMDVGLVKRCGLYPKYLDRALMMCYRAYRSSTTNAEDYFNRYSKYLGRYLEIDTVSTRSAFFRARELRRTERSDEVISLLLPYFNDPELSCQDVSVLGTYLASAYLDTGDSDNAAKWYAASSASDILCSKHLHMSLAKLAMILAGKGDRVRALRYIKIANDDAVSYNSASRVLEISPALSSISDSVLSYERTTRLVALGIAVLMVFLLSVALVSRRRVVLLSKKLRKMNLKVTEVNNDLREANLLKENYLMKYMVKCTSYINRIDEHTSDIRSILKNKGPEYLAAELRKPKYSDAEFKEFFAEFDSTFLRLFPGFLSAVNARTESGSDWQPGRGGALPMEMRVLAVMRIGITDNRDIAAFLNFPLTSIYTYRHRLKTSLRLSDETLEEFVQKINI